MEAYFMDSANEVSPNGEDILNLSAEFFDLSRVMDWLENALLQRVTQLRANYDEGRSALDEELPSVSFNSLQPATFVLNNLLRGLVLGAKAFTLTRNDALDFCHAVPAVAYANVATLDKQWKKRVKALPEPNHLAKVYYQREVDQLVEHREVLVSAK